MAPGECLDQELRDHRTLSLRASQVLAEDKPVALWDRLLALWDLVSQEEERTGN